MRRPIVAGNWKMHGTLADATELAHGVVRALGGFDGAEVVLCPSFTALAAVSAALEGSAIRLGAQDAHHESHGAYTGEVSIGMLRQTSFWLVL